MSRINPTVKLVADAGTAIGGTGAQPTPAVSSLLRPSVEPAPIAQPEIMQLLVEGPPSYVADTNGRILFANEALHRLAQSLGGDADADGGIACVLPLHEVLAEAVSNNSPVRREDVYNVNGGVLYLTSEHRPLHDAQGRITAIGGTFHDSTREASAWLEALAARERFRDIARLVSDWLWETDADFNLTYVSARAMEILGLHTHHMIGRSLFSLGTFQLGDTNVKPPTHSTRSPFRNATFAVPAANGSTCVFQLSGIPVFNEARGAFVGFRGTARDITDIKAREAALTTAKDMAEVANRSKGEFLANMSHELRTPLNAIIGFSEIMDRGSFGPLGNERYQGYVRDIIRSSRHLLGIINDILEAAKMEAGKLDLDEEAIDIVAATREIAQLLAEQAAQANLVVTIDAADSLPQLYADPRRLRQILLNLISNAIKFTPPDGHVTLEIGCAASGGITLVVADTGIGIAAEDLTKVLTPFGQVEGSLNRRHEGTGLGLPLSKALVELHGGEFHIDSAPGRGTRITIAFPASRTRPA